MPHKYAIYWQYIMITVSYIHMLTYIVKIFWTYALYLLALAYAFIVLRCRNWKFHDLKYWTKLWYKSVSSCYLWCVLIIIFFPSYTIKLPRIQHSANGIIHSRCQNLEYSYKQFRSFNTFIVYIQALDKLDSQIREVVCWMYAVNEIVSTCIHSKF